MINDVCPDVMPAVRFVRDIDQREPEVALILGSGLGHLAETVDEPTRIDTSEIPDYPATTVEGHKGRLVLGVLEDRVVAIVQGRLHYYEGHSVRDTAFTVRLLHGLGARRLIVTNAAGGINPLFRPGTIMFISDHLNVATDGPLSGPNTDGGPRFPDMSDPYSREWRRQAEGLALQAAIPTKTGVYVWTSGPSYETKAEINFFRRIGGDAVGMSTVPEVIQARYLGMRVLGISTITNAAAGLSETPLNHDEVLQVGNAVKREMAELVRRIVRHLP